MEELKGLATDKWYRALTYVGAGGLVGVVALGDDPRMRRALVLLCVGAALVGIGEWINHPFRARIQGHLYIRGYARKATFAGTVCLLFGLGLVGRAMYLLW
jgi:hypothetical protein